MLTLEQAEVTYDLKGLTATEVAAIRLVAGLSYSTSSYHPPLTRVYNLLADVSLGNSALLPTLKVDTETGETARATGLIWEDD